MLSVAESARSVSHENDTQSAQMTQGGRCTNAGLAVTTPAPPQGRSGVRNMAITPVLAGVSYTGGASEAIQRSPSLQLLLSGLLRQNTCRSALNIATGIHFSNGLVERKIREDSPQRGPLDLPMNRSKR